MPRPRRTGVISLAERASRVRTSAEPRARAGKGAPCEHPLGCPRPFTTWTIRGGRCDGHPLQPYEIPVIGPDDRWPWVRSAATTTLARARRGDMSDQPHPFARDPGAGRGICAECGLGIRATVHRADADEQEGDSLDG